ncbi:acetoacetate--CoA ligase [Paraburkholderia sp.]|uniref:acetoacetate--CoA ligase n=1 Tax=Paraburkholderia sp. TaxID=1926495 RepID=UPI002394D732|nr:acetoacetate--CoA ligase [Paraburkholderia sp.]MDE1182311.1 acetoacetate--CoA ligase [Paraburkholderia sp.]
MERVELFDASRGHGATSGRLPIYDGLPADIEASRLTAFTAALEKETGKSFADYAALHDFSVREFRTFWQFLLRSSEGLEWSGDAEPVCVGDASERATFFPNVKLNFADTLLNLAVAPADAPALTACHADGHKVRMTRGELRERVMRLADALTALGLREGDRVVAVMRNDSSAIVTALAVTALGATLSTAAPEMGVEAMIDRFVPLTPRLLFAHTKARAFDTGTSVANNVAALAAALPTLEGIVNLDDGELPATLAPTIHTLDGLTATGDAQRFRFPHLPFNHPLVVMFSSGTTGKPKCIVHGAGGTLLEHLKEHRLHSNLGPGDTLYFHTSCAWMMWNWAVSALASGVEVVTYDGPISSVDTLWRLVADVRVTVFGTSPAYLKMCADSGIEPGKQFDLSALRAMMSSGAVLHDVQFEWVHDHVKPVPLQSISGGTDILGCFVLGNPNMPVFAGEAQCKSLALDVQAWDEGKRIDGVGQLVCVNPFPSRPLGFHGDAEGKAFHNAYFAANPGVWTHGDLIEFPREGSARLHGRFDGVLNVRGINVGPGEIYRVLNDIPEIREAMAVEQRMRDTHASTGPSSAPGNRIVLLVVLRDGATLNGALTARIRRDLARRASPAHVPDRIVAVDAIPYTHNGKPSEAAARNAVNGLPVGNQAALRNPECLDAIRRHPSFHVSSRDMPPVGTTREELEAHLQAQWEKLFDFAPIGRDDNFFDLGGHSLLAAQLVADLRVSTGCAIPLATMMVAPTIRKLADVIEERDSASAAPTLMLVRAGTGTPLFVAHSVSGSVMEVLGLIRALRSPRPVYGLQARGLDGEQEIQRRVEEMAASYVEQMRTVQPSGPYAIAGYSFGGLIAFEIAQQLRQAGEQIELLFMLDTYVEEELLPLPARMRHRWGIVNKQWRKLRSVSAKELPSLVRRAMVSASDRARMRAGVPVLRPDEFTATLPPVLRRVRETMGAAMANYKPRPYDASPIVYVRARTPMQERGDPLLLWRRIARAGLKIAEISGDHADMIGEPTVQLVAAVLDEGLGERLDEKRAA